MIVKLDGLGALKAADKAKAKPRAGGVGGPNFADLLDEAQAADEAAPAVIGGGIGVAGGFVPLEEDDVPRDAQGQARELLKTLRDLAGEALGNEPAAAVHRLAKLAADVDESTLNAAQKQALDEVRTRAAVEVAKLKH